jgi:hypothetical protein
MFTVDMYEEDRHYSSILITETIVLVCSYTGMVMKARSSKSMRYKLILRDTTGWDAVAWCYSFDLPVNKVSVSSEI